MPTKKPLSLQSLRSTVSDIQRAILDEVWKHVTATQIGIPERPLFEKFGKTTLAAKVRKLGGTIVYSNHEENKLRYNLAVVGVFLTSDGPRLGELVERYLIVLRDAYKKDNNIERFSSKDLALWAPDLTASELNELKLILYRAHGSFASRIAGWNTEEWFGSVDDDVVELKSISDWRAYIESRILKWYDPGQPSDEGGRAGYLASKAEPDPVWDAIRQLNEPFPLRIRSLNKRRPKSARRQRTHAGRRLGLTFIADDAPLRRILEDDWKEACRDFRGKAWKSCVLLCGGIVEGLLLWQLEHVQKNEIEKGGGGTPDIRYDGEMLSGVIRKSKDQKLIGEDEGFLLDWANTYRNIIHPGNQRRKQKTPMKSHADLALKLVQVVADGVRSKNTERLSRGAA